MKHDFTKTMRNVQINDTDDQRTRKRLSRDFSVMVELEPGDKLRYQGFMKQELAFYNSLINAFTARTRTFPEHILALNEQWIKLFGQIAFEGKSIKHLERAPADAQLTEGMEIYRRYLVGHDSEGQRYLTERMLNIMEAAASPGVIHPIVRKSMALEMVRFYKEQAQKFATPANQGSGDDLYKSTPEMLEPADMLKKRHLQMPRQMINIEWDEDKEQTLLRTAYVANPIIIKNINLVENKDWTHAIIHQEPNTVSRPSSPWFVDIKTLPVGYQIKYMDMPNPRTGQTFAIAKKRDFS